MAITPLTTAALVNDILDVEVDEDAITPFITPASMVIQARCVPLAYTSDEIQVLATWLTAHLYEVQNPRLRQQMIGKSSESILTQVDLGLELTHPGQQLMLLDYLGGLVGLGAKRKKVKFLWLGTPRRDRNRNGWYGDTWGY